MDTSTPIICRSRFNGRPVILLTEVDCFSPLGSCRCYSPKSLVCSVGRDNRSPSQRVTIAKRSSEEALLSPGIRVRGKGSCRGLLLLSGISHKTDTVFIFSYKTRYINCLLYTSDAADE